MRTVEDMTAMARDLAESDFTEEELEALEREHPELGRIEEIDGALHATGGSAVGDLHQLICQRLHLLFHPLTPEGQIIRLDVWWISPRGKLRADLAVYRPEDRPVNRKSFRVPAQAVLEVLSDDAFHDVVRKEGVYAEYGVEHRAFLDPRERGGWWLRLDGVDHTGDRAEWQLPGWPPIPFDRAALLAD